MFRLTEQNSGKVEKLQTKLYEFNSIYIDYISYLIPIDYTMFHLEFFFI